MKKEICSFCGREIGKMPAVASPKAMICKQCIHESLQILKLHENGELINNMMKLTVIDLGSTESQKELVKYTCYFHGSSSSSAIPGEDVGIAHCSFVIFDGETEINREVNIPLGRESLVSAKYSGLIYLLSYLISIKAKDVEIMSDSLGVINQISGRWRVTDLLKSSYTDTKRLIDMIPACSFKLIPREKNLAIFDT